MSWQREREGDVASMPGRKIRASDHHFTDEQRKQVKSLLEKGREMGFTWDQETVLEAVFILSLIHI